MEQGSHTLQDEIRDIIRRQGPIPFESFMELALYHPTHGYYSNPELVIGRQGDFYTNVSVGSLFGQLIGQQFAEMWELLGRPDPFYIVEQGAHTGQFCADVMVWASRFQPEMAAAVHHVFVEPKPRYRQRQQETLAAHGIDTSRTLWVDDLTTLESGGITGVFFSNELLDSFPVHRIQYKDDQWHELHVTWEDGQFRYTPRPITRPDLQAAVARLPRMHIQRYTTEINLRMGTWISEVSRALGRGFVFCIDYGYPTEMFYNASRVDGTLSCFHRHRRRFNALDLPGEQDITSHVDFTALRLAGEAAGLTMAGYTDQHHFMVGIAHDDLAGFESRTPEELGLAEADYRKMIRAFKTLMHPESMGTTFKYFLMQKGVDPAQVLSGWQFARPW